MAESRKQSWMEKSTATTELQDEFHETMHLNYGDAEQASDHGYFAHHALAGDRSTLLQRSGQQYHMPVPSVTSRDDAYMMTAPPVASVVPWLESMVVTSFVPSIAQPGNQVTITLQSCIPPKPSLPLYFFIGFQGIYSAGILKKTAQSSQHVDFMLSTHVPTLPYEPSSGPVPVSMVVENAAGDRLMDRRIGQLNFANIDHIRSQITPFRTTGKRKASLDSQFYPDVQSKRSRWSNVHGFDLPYPLTNSVPSPPSSQGANVPNYSRDGFHQSRMLSSRSGQAYLTPGRIAKPMSNHATTRAMEEAQSTALTRSLSAFEGRLPVTPQYSSPTTNFDTGASYTRSAVSSSPVMSTAPFVGSRMRLSSLGGELRAGPQNSRTALALEADLETMLRDWTAAELEAKRRLVVFERRQLGNTIAASFKAVSPEDHAPGSICVSCIWWESKGAGYITSVDTISLAESLCGYKFNVPVKNRIRRNMEGYKPITVAKDKEECEDFFKVIMSFTNPKPRNIEKHIKVFPWTCLDGALKKIVGKYGRSSPTVKASGSTTAAKQAATGTSNALGLGGGGSGFGEELSEDAFMQPFSPASGASSYEVGMERRHSGKATNRATASPAFQPSAMYPTDTDTMAYRPYQPRLEPNLAQLVPQLQHNDYYYWPQVQFPDESLYRSDDGSIFGGWGLPSSTFFDPNLTATPTSLQLNPQHSGGALATSLPELGLPLMQAQYAEDQPIGGGRTSHGHGGSTDECFRGVTHL